MSNPFAYGSSDDESGKCELKVIRNQSASGYTTLIQDSTFHSDAGDESYFGWAIDIKVLTTTDGNGDPSPGVAYIAVGAPGKGVIDSNDLTGYTFKGKAYVFTHDGSTWTQKGDELYERAADKLTADGVTTNASKAQFGYSIAISDNGERVIVGARKFNEALKDDSTNPKNLGGAFIFHWDSSASDWVLAGYHLDDTDSGSTSDVAEIGYSVAMSGDGLKYAWSAPFQGKYKVMIWEYNTGTSSYDNIGTIEKSGYNGFGSNISFDKTFNMAYISYPEGNSNKGIIYKYQYKSDGATSAEKWVTPLIGDNYDDEITSENDNEKLSMVECSQTGEHLLIGSSNLPYNATYNNGAAYYYSMIKKSTIGDDFFVDISNNKYVIKLDWVDTTATAAQIVSTDTALGTALYEKTTYNFHVADGEAYYFDLAAISSKNSGTIGTILKSSHTDKTDEQFLLYCIGELANPSDSSYTHAAFVINYTDTNQTEIKEAVFKNSIETAYYKPDSSYGQQIYTLVAHRDAAQTKI